MNEQYYHWYLGENILRNDDATCLVNFEYGVAIFFPYGDSYFATFEEFESQIANVQFFSGDRPKNIDKIMIEAWNFLAEFEREEENRFEDSDIEFN